MSELSYILKLRNSLKDELRHMPLFQNGSALIILNENGEVLLQKRTDRDQWCLPGGLQELGETFEEVAIREMHEETGLVGKVENLRLVAVVSGESRKNSYPNGDIVYNNTVLYEISEYEGTLHSDYSELVDTNDGFIMEKETAMLEFFGVDSLPHNLMDKDLIEIYVRSKNVKY